MNNPFKFHESDERTDAEDGYETEQDQRKDIDNESDSFVWIISAIVAIMCFLIWYTNS